jgi:hypothetical protein
MLVAEMIVVLVKDIAALPGFFVQTALEGITILCILFNIRALYRVHSTNQSKV